MPCHKEFKPIFRLDFLVHLTQKSFVCTRISSVSLSLHSRFSGIQKKKTKTARVQIEFLQWDILQNNTNEQEIEFLFKFE